jgi:hypothetical protein
MQKSGNRIYRLPLFSVEGLFALLTARMFFSALNRGVIS